MAVEIRLVPCLSDNYAVLLRNHSSGATAAVDAPEPEPILRALDASRWSLTHILITHKHGDHVQGIGALKKRFPAATVIGPRGEAGEIPMLDRAVGESDMVEVGELRARVFETPGHTAGHICYWFEEENLLFSGDTLFALGCGRPFERPPAVLWQSLLKLRRLPDETMIYCGHEYTLSNARFAVTVDPTNAALQSRLQSVQKARDAGQATIPSRLGEEKATNPFLRADDAAVARAVGMQGAQAAEVFAELRRRKNEFRG